MASAFMESASMESASTRRGRTWVLNGVLSRVEGITFDDTPIQGIVDDPRETVDDYVNEKHLGPFCGANTIVLTDIFVHLTLALRLRKKIAPWYDYEKIDVTRFFKEEGPRYPCSKWV